MREREPRGLSVRTDWILNSFSQPVQSFVLVSPWWVIVRLPNKSRNQSVGKKKTKYRKWRACNKMAAHVQKCHLSSRTDSIKRHVAFSFWWNSNCQKCDSRLKKKKKRKFWLWNELKERKKKACGCWFCRVVFFFLLCCYRIVVINKQTTAPFSV